MLPCVAEIVVVPSFRSEVRPVELIVAMAGLDEAQVTELVRFGVEPSVNFPVATNCSEMPTASAIHRRCADWVHGRIDVFVVRHRRLLVLDVASAQVWLRSASCLKHGRTPFALDG